MRIFLLSILLSATLVVFAQSDSEPTAQQTRDMIEKEFAKVDKTKLTELVPFKKKDKWGFIYASTRKVAVNPCFTFINLFNPDFIGFCGKWEVEITANPFSVDVHEQRVYCNDACSGLFERVFVISSKTNFKGFTVDITGKLESYSDIYYIDENRRDISDPFEYNYQLFVIASRNDSTGIIDIFGDPLDGFNFNYKKIILNSYAFDKRNRWFYVEEFSGKRYFINTAGEKKFENEALKIPLFTNINFGLSVVNNDTISGVFNLNKMEWMIKPQRKNMIDILYYTSKTEIDPLNPKNLDKVKLFFLAHNKKSEYYVDEKLKAYLPR